MSSTEQTTIILGAVALCLLIFVINQECKSRSHQHVGILGSIQSALGSKGKKPTLRKTHKKSIGGVDFVREGLELGSGRGKLVSNNPSDLVTADFSREVVIDELGNPFASDDRIDNLKSEKLGAKSRGSSYPELLKRARKNKGDKDHGKHVHKTSHEDSAFPFTKSSGKDEPRRQPASSGNVKHNEKGALGGVLEDVFGGAQEFVSSSINSIVRSESSMKEGVAPFESEENLGSFRVSPDAPSEELGMGMSITSAFTPQGSVASSGLTLEQAYGPQGVAVGPSPMTQTSVLAAPGRSDDIDFINVRGKTDLSCLFRQC